jgi:hypothetical protein
MFLTKLAGLNDWPDIIDGVVEHWARNPKTPQKCLWYMSLKQIHGSLATIHCVCMSINRFAAEVRVKNLLNSEHTKFTEAARILLTLRGAGKRHPNTIQKGHWPTM